MKRDWEWWEAEGLEHVMSMSGGPRANDYQAGAVRLPRGHTSCATG